MRSSPTLAFVSAPGGSLFMEELLASVADAVERAGGSARCHRGRIEEVIDPSTVAIVVPHEYLVLQPGPPPTPAVRRRTIAFGVEHPGTETFRTAAAAAGSFGGSVEISRDAVVEMRRRGVRTRPFVLGYSPRWDQHRLDVSRDIDILCLATADERRLGALSAVAGDLAGARAELLLPPHEQMTVERPDFVIGERKRELLARSRLLLNLHREGTRSFEWVRALDAIRSRCVVLTTPSTGLAPLVPGEHVLVAAPSRIGRVATAVLQDPELITAMADAAYARCREQLDMVASARDLIDLAVEVDTASRRSRRHRRRPRPHGREPARPATPDPAEPTMAVWVPTARHLPGDWDPDRAVRSPLTAVSPEAIETRRVDPAEVDVICVQHRRSGPLSLTLDSLAGTSVGTAVHLASDGAGDLPTLDSAPSLATRIVYADPVGRGFARNQLLIYGSAPLVLVIDAGDEVLGDSLADLVSTLAHHPDVAVSYPMAVHGSAMIVNALIPEARRLQRFAYLDRGYVVSRPVLDRIGGYERAGVDGLVDHDLWWRMTAAGVGIELRRHVGMRLWDQGSAAVADAPDTRSRAV
jgi:hypothetical protein